MFWGNLVGISVLVSPELKKGFLPNYRPVGYYSNTKKKLCLNLCLPVHSIDLHQNSNKHNYVLES